MDIAVANVKTPQLKLKAQAHAIHPYCNVKRNPTEHIHYLFILAFSLIIAIFFNYYIIIYFFNYYNLLFHGIRGTQYRKGILVLLIRKSFDRICSLLVVMQVFCYANQMKWQNLLFLIEYPLLNPLQVLFLKLVIESFF